MSSRVGLRGPYTAAAARPRRSRPCRPGLAWIACSASIRARSFIASTNGVDQCAECKRDQARVPVLDPPDDRLADLGRDLRLPHVPPPDQHLASSEHVRPQALVGVVEADRPDREPRLLAEWPAIWLPRKLAYACFWAGCRSSQTTTVDRPRAGRADVAWHRAGREDRRRRRRPRSSLEEIASCGGSVSLESVLLACRSFIDIVGRGRCDHGPLHDVEPGRPRRAIGPGAAPRPRHTWPCCPGRSRRRRGSIR